MKKIPRPPRGFLAMDAVAAIVIALFLLMALTTLIVKQRSAENRLAAHRAAARSAEAILLHLQAGEPLPDIAQPKFNLEPLPDPAPSGQKWVRLTLSSTEKSPATTLVGLVPAKTNSGAAQ